MTHRIWVLLAVAAVAAGCSPTGGSYHKRFDDAAAWAAVFDDPARDEWQRPGAVVTALGLKPGDRVADLGAGTGYFAVRLARAVPDGTVFAADIEPDMVRHLGGRADREGLTNLVPVLAAADDPRLPAAVDLALVVDTYHHIPDRPAYFARLRRSLAAGGRVVIIDFTRDSPTGPPVDHRVTEERVMSEMAEAGYVAEPFPLSLPRQYALAFRPRDAAGVPPADAAP